MAVQRNSIKADAETVERSKGGICEQVRGEKFFQCFFLLLVL